MRAPVILAVVVLLFALSHYARAQVTPDALTALSCPPETDPAGGVQKASELFDACEVGGDLAGALAVFRAVRGWVGGPGQQWVLIDDMARRAEVLARERGDLGAVAELLEVRVQCAVLAPGGLSYPYRGAGQHFARIFAAAAAARERAGLAPASSAYQTQYEAQAALADADPAAHWVESQPVNPGLLGTIRAVERAAADERYDSALDGVTRLMDDLERSLGTSTGGTAQTDYTRLVGYIGQHISMPGGDRLIGPFRALVDRYGDLNRGGMTLESAMEACVYGWTGRDDAYRDAFYWCLGHSRQERHQPPVASVGLFCFKLNSFRRGQEAQDLLRRLLAMTGPERRQPELPAWNAHRLAWAGMPDDLLGQVLSLVKREARLMLESPPRWFVVAPRTFVASVGGQVAHVVGCSSSERRSFWAQDGGAALQGLALAISDGEARAACLLSAADLFDQGSRPDLAAECRELAKALAAADPLTALRFSLAAAPLPASEGKWEEVAKALAAAVVGAPDGVELLQATILLQEAALRLGKPAEAEKWMTKAKGLVDTLALPPGEKANYLVTLAGLCELAAQAAEGGVL